MITINIIDKDKLFWTSMIRQPEFVTLEVFEEAKKAAIQGDIGLDTYEIIASDVFRQYGLSFDTAERAGGWTNAVWINGNFVLRLSKKRDSDFIRREIERSKILPSSVGYPENIAVGVSDGYEWSLSKRVCGKALSDVWNDLNWEEKSSAVKQILGIMDKVHSADIGLIEHLTYKTAWYSSFNKSDSFADIERYMTLKIFTSKQGAILCDILDRFYKLNAVTASVLCHGDITTDNLLWNEGRIVSLLDFEHSVIAPRQLDLHSLVNLALLPYNEANESEIILLTDNRQAVQDYVSEMISLFRPYLSNQDEKDLFLGYNVLYRQRFLEFWLENSNGQIENCDAYQKMVSLCNGTGGYLDKLINYF